MVRTERDDFDTLSATLATILPQLVELRQQDNIRGFDLVWFILSWVLQRRPQGERARWREVLRGQIQQQELQNKVETMGKLLEKTWKEEWLERLQQAAQQAREATLVEAREAARETALITGRETILELLSERFGTVPESVALRIQACSDTARLKAALRQILHIQAADELIL